MRVYHTECTYVATNTQDLPGFLRILSFLQRLPRLATEIPALVVPRGKKEERFYKKATYCVFVLVGNKRA